LHIDRNRQKKRDQILMDAFIKNKPVIERCIARYVNRNPVNYDIQDLYQISFEVLYWQSWTIKSSGRIKRARLFPNFYR